MAVYFVKGIQIGLIFGIPAGAIGALTIKRTLGQGFVAGFMTGLGSSAADVIYAIIGAFGITMVSSFVEKYKAVFSIAGGMIIFIMGAAVLLHRSEDKKLCQESVNKKICFLSSFMIAITNPATVFSFLAAFSIFEISGKLSVLDGTGLVLGVFAGTVCWWLFLSGGVSVLRSHITERIHVVLNSLLGWMLILFGILAMIKNNI